MTEEKSALLQLARVSNFGYYATYYKGNIWSLPRRRRSNFEIGGEGQIGTFVARSHFADKITAEGFDRPRTSGFSAVVESRESWLDRELIAGHIVEEETMKDQEYISVVDEYDNLLKPVRIASKVISIWPLEKDHTTSAMLLNKCHLIWLFFVVCTFEISSNKIPLEK